MKKAKKARKWEMLRVRSQTHGLLVKASGDSGVPMVELVERIVNLIYGRKTMSTMQALAFFVMYLDGKPTYVVAAKDAEAAESGMRQNLLGQGVKTVKATPFMEADEKDVLRLGLASLFSQMTQMNAALSTLLAQQGARGSLKLS